MKNIVRRNPEIDYMTANLFWVFKKRLETINQIINNGCLGQSNNKMLHDIFYLLNNFVSGDDIFASLASNYECDLQDIFVKTIPLVLALTDCNQKIHPLLNADDEQFNIEIMKQANHIRSLIPYKLLIQLHKEEIDNIHKYYREKLNVKNIKQKRFELEEHDFVSVNPNYNKRKNVRAFVRFEEERIQKAFGRVFQNTQNTNNVTWKFPLEIVGLLDMIRSCPQLIIKKQNHFGYIHNLDAGLKQVIKKEKVDEIINGLLLHPSNILFVFKTLRSNIYRIKIDIKYQSDGQKMFEEENILDNFDPVKFAQGVASGEIKLNNQGNIRAGFPGSNERKEFQTKENNQEEHAMVIHEVPCNKTKIEKKEPASESSDQLDIKSSEESIDNNFKVIELPLEAYNFLKYLKRIADGGNTFKKLIRIVETELGPYHKYKVVIDLLKKEGLINKIPGSGSSWQVNVDCPTTNTGKTIFESEKWDPEIPKLDPSNYTDTVFVSQDEFNLIANCRAVSEDNLLVGFAGIIKRFFRGRKDIQSGAVARMKKELLENEVIFCLGGPNKQNYHYYLNPYVTVQVKEETLEQKEAVPVVKTISLPTNNVMDEVQGGVGDEPKVGKLSSLPTELKKKIDELQAWITKVQYNQEKILTGQSEIKANQAEILKGQQSLQEEHRLLLNSQAKILSAIQDDCDHRDIVLEVRSLIEKRMKK